MTSTDLPVLASDCASCAGLCCVLLPFARESGFGATKAGGVACHHLDTTEQCGIHDQLRERGWPGCTVFECFGAGQHVTQVTYGGRSWRDVDDLGEMGAVLSVVRRLHEMRLHLETVAPRSPSPDGDRLVARILDLRDADPERLLLLDLDDLQAEVGAALAEVSARIRAGWAGPDLTRRDLAGHRLAGHDLRGAALRGAVLIGADLSGADLTDADLLGADLRDADVRGARLAHALFLTQPQVNAARGDASTTVPAALSRPRHWPARRHQPQP